MKTFNLVISIAAAFVPFISNAASDNRAPVPCQKIAEVCEAAGFTKGDWKKGNGLWHDCVAPIIQGVKSPPGAAKPLPIVSASNIVACKATKPKFVNAKVSS